MEDTKINKEGIIKMFPELYDNFIPGFYYKYYNGGVAYFKGFDIQTFGVNASFDLVSGTSAWFSPLRKDSRGFDNYTVATILEVQDHFKGALARLRFKADVLVKYRGEIYTLTGSVIIINDNVSMCARQNLSAVINIPVIFGGYSRLHEIHIV